MVIRALSVQQFSEDSGANHVQDEQFAVPVTTILHDHAVTAGLFRRVNNLLALFDGVYGRNFHAGVRSALHGGYGHGSVPVPGCGDVNEIEIVAFAEIFVVVLAVGVNFGALAAAFLHHFLGVSGVLFYRVTDRIHLYVRNRQEIRQHAGAAAADSNYTEAHGISGLKFHANHRFVCGGGRRWAAQEQTRTAHRLPVPRRSSPRRS